MRSTLIKLSILSVIVCAVCLLSLPTVRAAHVDQLMWNIELQEMLTINKAAYPDSNWGPYFQQASKLGVAAARGDDAAVRAELEQMSKMLDKGDIDENAAADITNFVHYWHQAVAPPSKLVRKKK